MRQVSESQIRQTIRVNIVTRPPVQPEPVRTPLAFNVANTSWCLLLDVGESGTTQTLQLNVLHELIIGRSDLIDGHVPDFDLGPYGGQDYGVSRKHATLFVEESSLYIRDLASTNGTRVNGYPLERDQPHKLAQGDEIELGQLRFILRALTSQK